MASFKIKNVKSVLNAIKSGFQDSFQRKEIYEKIGKFTANRVKQETQKGKDLSRGGAPQPQLSEGYIRIRELIQKGKLIIDPPQGRVFRFNRSNLTLTGQLLESVDAEVKPRDGTVTVFPTGPREKTVIFNPATGKGLFGEESESDLDQPGTNQELADDLAKRGRTFLGMDQKGVKRIRRIVLDEVRRVISKL